MWLLFFLFLIILVAIGSTIYVTYSEHRAEDKSALTPAERERAVRDKAIGFGCAGLWVAICILIGFCIYGVGQAAKVLGGPEEPPKSQVIYHFLDHHADFEQLRNMFEADAAQGRLVRIGFEKATEPDYKEVIDRTIPPLPADRLNAYIALFRRLNLKNGEMDQDRKLRLTYHFNGGLLDAGPFCTGYAYPAPPPDAYHPPDLPGKWEIDVSCYGLSVGVRAEENRVWGNTGLEEPLEADPPQEKDKKTGSK